MNKFIITYDWVARAVISVKGESEEEVCEKLLEIFPNVEIRSVQMVPSEN